MPLVFLARCLSSAVSLALLGAAVYCLASWWNGAAAVDPQGVVYPVREPWRLWTGAALVAWSMLGRFPATFLLAKPDTRPTWPERGEPLRVASPTGASLYVEQHGPIDAPPVILTHGWGLDSTIWRYLRRDLSGRFRVIVWDLPGLGRSRAARGQAVDLEHFAQDLKAVLAATTRQPAVLVGHSIGGMTIQTLVRDDPQALDGVAGLVLINTTYTNPLRTMAFSTLALALRRPLIEPLLRLTIWLQPLAWILAWQGYLSGSAHLANRIGFADRVTRSQLEHTTLLATRNPPGASARGNLAMFDWDAHGALGEVGRPILILAGARDVVTTPQASAVMAAEAPGARYAVMPHSNHMGFLECSSLYNPEIARFCDAVLKTGREG